MEEVYHYVQKSRNILLPSITAAFNSTVKEGMFMGIPIIMYDTEISHMINSIVPTLITAQMENVGDLAEKMLYALDNEEVCGRMAKTAQTYANTHYSGSAAGELLIKVFDEICGNQNYKDMIYKPMN